MKAKKRTTRRRGPRKPEPLKDAIGYRLACVMDDGSAEIRTMTLSRSSGAKKVARWFARYVAWKVAMERRGL